MEKQLNEIYYKIAYKVIDMIPVEWDKVYLLGYVGEKQSFCTVTFYFIDSDTKEIVRVYDIPKKYDFSEEVRKKLLVDLANIILELNKCFIDNGQEPWYEVEFTMESSGKFDVNFNYDVDKEVAGLLSGEIIWAYNKFKYRKDISYYNRTLKKYFGV